MVDFSKYLDIEIDLVLFRVYFSKHPKKKKTTPQDIVY